MARRALPSAPALSPLTGGRRIRKHRALAPLLGGGLLTAAALGGVVLTLL